MQEVLGGLGCPWDRMWVRIVTPQVRRHTARLGGQRVEAWEQILRMENRVGSGEGSEDWGEFDSTEVLSTLRTRHRPPWRPVDSLEIQEWGRERTHERNHRRQLELKALFPNFTQCLLQVGRKPRVSTHTLWHFFSWGWPEAWVCALPFLLVSPWLQARGLVQQGELTFCY